MSQKYQLYRRKQLRAWTKIACVVVAVAVIGAGIGLWHVHTSRVVSFAAQPVAPNGLQLASSLSSSEQQTLKKLLAGQQQPLKVTVQTVLQTAKANQALAVYVPVTNAYAGRQAITTAELKTTKAYAAASIVEPARSALAAAVGLKSTDLLPLADTASLDTSAVAFVPVADLTPQLKLLSFNGAYYLDSFQAGAVFREVGISGPGAAQANTLAFNNNPTADTTLKVNMTGTTALTRRFMLQLSTVKAVTDYSQQIAPFLAAADITHVSNEVSFKQGCTENNTTFCALPQMIDVLKASGVDLVELSGNHNNDEGAQNDTDTINLYHSLGWHTIGGGVNSTEAAKPYIADSKKSKVAFLAYNYADGIHSGEIATDTMAGGNPFVLDKVKADIAAAKQQADFVIVDVQYHECYAYPGGYTEYPQCDVPVAGQKEDFRQIADMGANMVIGTQAHHPQTFELYKGTPIYYGLGNLYFDQIEQPGTERGIILTHYFVGGKLLQTKLSPTIYGKELQTHLMPDADAVKFLQRLDTARHTAGL